MIETCGASLAPIKSNGGLVAGPLLRGHGIRRRSIESQRHLERYIAPSFFRITPGFLRGTRYQHAPKKPTPQAGGLRRVKGLDMKGSSYCRLHNHHEKAKKE